MKKILFATGNAAKAKRFSKGLAQKGIEVLCLKDIDLDIDVEENGTTAIENALIKARAYEDKTDYITFAMDDTLYLEGVPENEQPGMFVRRVNGKRLNDQEMIEHYSSLATKYGEKGKLKAKWVYGMALINNGEEFTYTWSKSHFYITNKPSDKVKEGYPLNTISVNIELNKYFNDMTEEDQLKVQQNEDHVVDFIASHVN